MKIPVATLSWKTLGNVIWRFAALLWTILVMQACKSTAVEPSPNPPRQSIVALRLACDGGFVYACAGPAGVWKRRVQDETWTYLGLADSSQLAIPYKGAQDIDVKDGDILVAYNGSALGRNPDSSFAVWRSTDNGIHWFRSDAGIPQTRKYPDEFDVLNAIKRSPHNPNMVVGVAGPAVYRSTDGGTNWSLQGTRGAAVGYDYMWWHPARPGEIWIFGQGPTFYPYLIGRTEYGLTFKARVDFAALGFLNEGIVYDVGFDLANPDTIYSVTSNGPFRTSDGGNSWQRIATTSPLRDASLILNLPGKNKAYVVATLHSLYRTSNGMSQFTIIRDFAPEIISAMAIDSASASLFVGTNKEVYAVPMPSN